MDLYEYSLEENKVLDKYRKRFNELDEKLMVPDCLNNCKHNLKVKKSQLELAKYYSDKIKIEKLKMDINYYISKIKKEETNIYETLFSNAETTNYSEKDINDYNTLLNINKKSDISENTTEVFDSFFANTTSLDIQ